MNMSYEGECWKAELLRGDGIAANMLAMSSQLPCIAVTMGDPAGVGPEICLRLLAEASMAEVCVPVVFGDAEVLRRVAKVTGLPFDAPVIQVADWAEASKRVSVPSVLDLRQMKAEEVVPGKLSAVCGEAAYQYVSRAIDAALACQVQGVATAPLNKEAMHLAGHKYPGHTEIFAERMGAERSCMMQYSEEITCSFVTVHCGYHEVPKLITTARILEVIELTASALRRIRGREPKLLVCGLNPHAGENGLFGDREEERFIVPAIELARAKGIDLTGPVPPDTAFTPARRREFDAVVCMYHDQGHIPVKMIAFESAVNTTLGLPVVRTSVDHGTAFDIAWQGKASPSSLYSAVRLAAKLAKERPHV
ncbi:MAG: 4-hydroxythreonine-4-phosphate dehydrogenase [Verrucomicrobia bacterium]|nr:4-hydroxythreonine-4-phosphate dehydrogenase [Verrucomicrobiota bacterium]